MNILITGGSGLIGKALTRLFSDQGDQVWILSRNPEKQADQAMPPRARLIAWDGKSPSGWEEQVEQADAIVNLAGENIGSSPWSPERKQRILNSRLTAGAAVTAAIRGAKHRPRVLIQSSAVGIYGPLRDEFVSEDSPLGSDFLSGVARQWENSTREVEDLGVRRVILRSSIVLTRAGGILSNFELPVRLFVGGPLGSGEQWLPWIHVADEVGAIRFLINQEAVRGPINLCAPDVVRQADFSRTLARVLHRPYWAPVPAFVLRLVLGQMSTLVLDGQRQVPQRLIDSGYTFQFPSLLSALENLYHPAK